MIQGAFLSVVGFLPGPTDMHCTFRRILHGTATCCSDMIRNILFSIWSNICNGKCRLDLKYVCTWTLWSASHESCDVFIWHGVNSSYTMALPDRQLCTLSFVIYKLVSLFKEWVVTMVINNASVLFGTFPSIFYSFNHLDTLEQLKHEITFFFLNIILLVACFIYFTFHMLFIFMTLFVNYCRLPGV